MILIAISIKRNYQPKNKYSLKLNGYEKILKAAPNQRHSQHPQGWSMFFYITLTNRSAETSVNGCKIGENGKSHRKIQEKNI